MPELPEVETTKRGIEPHLLGQTILSTHVYQPKLRWPVDHDLAQKLHHQAASSIQRRAKYILIHFEHGSLIVHLGMSGSLRLVERGTPRLKHDHLECELANGLNLRLHDPRRFGALVWTDAPPAQHPLLLKLGVEPLDETFSAQMLHPLLLKRKTAIKPVLMDAHLVVGIGNIYANEALFLAGIDPRRPSHSLSQHDTQNLVTHIKSLLQQAIQQGGTTLRDFISPEGRPGYFQQTLNVYGRSGKPCHVCGMPIEHITQAQRRSFYCPVCQH
ncbi:MAG: DNA-formamidopyrimidine glycosylase [Gammaproteobacteria bacterium 28-57-27]|nr:MAG: DNA-formamidopyrimidine glycosylase [Gammaproteobacteria bacterium 28-57-27]